MIVKIYNTIRFGYKMYGVYCMISKAVIIASYSLILYDILFKKKN